MILVTEQSNISNNYTTIVYWQAILQKNSRQTNIVLFQV